MVAAAVLAPRGTGLAIGCGALLLGVAFFWESWRARKRRAVLRHVGGGGTLPPSGDPQLDQLLIDRRGPPADSGEAACLDALSAWSTGDFDPETAVGSSPVGGALARLREALVADRERVRLAAAELAAAAERGQQHFQEPARRVEACAEALRKATETVAAEMGALESAVDGMEGLAARWEAEQAEASRAKEAAAWSRQRLERALDPHPWGALDREEEQIATALHRLIGNLEREPDHPERMVWLGQARGQVESLERHRAAVHQGIEAARRALINWKPAPEPDRRELEASLQRVLGALRGSSEGWREYTRRAEEAAAGAVASMPDAEWWAEELIRLQWELELRIVEGSTGPEFRARLEAVLARQRDGRTPAAASLARGLERLEARLGEHASELEASVRRLERLSGSS